MGTAFPSVFILQRPKEYPDLTGNVDARSINPSEFIGGVSLSLVGNYAWRGTPPIHIMQPPSEVGTMRVGS